MSSSSQKTSSIDTSVPVHADSTEPTKKPLRRPSNVNTYAANALRKVIHNNTKGTRVLVSPDALNYAADIHTAILNTVCRSAKHISHTLAKKNNGRIGKLAMLLGSKGNIVCRAIPGLPVRDVVKKERAETKRGRSYIASVRYLQTCLENGQSLKEVLEKFSIANKK